MQKKIVTIITQNNISGRSLGKETKLANLLIIGRTSYRVIDKLKAKKRNARRIDNAKGSMSVEAAFAVPLFIFCMINLLYGIQVVETSSRITAALHETGNEICSYGYAVQNSIGEGTPAGIASMAYASTSVAKHLGSVTDKRGGIRGGIAGISYLGSSVLSDGGLVNLKVTYGLKFPVNMNIHTYRLGTSYYGHAWVGYDGFAEGDVGDEEDPIVYVTASGSVYHTDIHCSHLNPTLKSVPVSEIGDLRNKDRSKYYACESCGGSHGTGNVYITEYGNRYHSNVNCNAIKRNISTVHISEVGGRRKCATCGG